MKKLTTAVSGDDEADEGLTYDGDTDTEETVAVTPNADGTYTLESLWDNETLDMSVPEGFELWEGVAESDYLYFINELSDDDAAVMEALFSVF